jgi:hypothetical protein
MAVSQRADRDACTKVEVRFPGLIPNPSSLTAGQGKIKPSVSRHDIVAVKLSGGCGLHQEMLKENE